MAPAVFTDIPAEKGTERWTALRVTVVACCFLLSMLDGADILAMSLIAPAISREWLITPASLGLILSASLAGMAIGCLAVAPFADRFGRRALIVGSLIVTTGAIGASAAVQTVPELMILRFLTGIGVGTIGVCMTALAAEFAPANRRSLAVSFVQAGWPLCAIFVSFGAAAFLPAYGWRPMLAAIGICSGILLLAILILLPESVSFLTARGRPGDLDRVNRIRRRLALEPLAVMPVPKGSRTRFTLRALFDNDRGTTSALLWSAVTMAYFVLYFAISWIPKMEAERGLSIKDAILAGALYNLGAFIGTLLVGWLGSQGRLPSVIAFFLLFAAGALIMFGIIASPLSLVLLIALLIGVTVQGGFNGYWALAAELYPAEMRSTGIGWALGVGRIGAVLGPIAGGLLMQANVPIPAIFLIYAIPALIAAILTVAIGWNSYRKRAR
ncbi:MFS transporter [Sphingobium xenophagum]|uniref:MFS transporter n=1 Tax=Sphingobium xenophagum TaxID=121428 RepID=UPI000364DB2F|nr:MFS transporter [Sphingobium xenophagum]